MLIYLIHLDTSCYILGQNWQFLLGSLKGRPQACESRISVSNGVLEDLTFALAWFRATGNAPLDVWMRLLYILSLVSLHSFTSISNSNSNQQNASWGQICILKSWQFPCVSLAAVESCCSWRCDAPVGRCLWSANSSGSDPNPLPAGGFMGGFHEGGSPIAGWFIRENPIYKWMIEGYLYFRKPPFSIQSPETETRHAWPISKLSFWKRWDSLPHQMPQALASAVGNVWWSDVIWSRDYP